MRWQVFSIVTFVVPHPLTVLSILAVEQLVLSQEPGPVLLLQKVDWPAQKSLQKQRTNIVRLTHVVQPVSKLLTLPQEMLLREHKLLLQLVMRQLKLWIQDQMALLP